MLSLFCTSSSKADNKRGNRRSQEMQSQRNGQKGAEVSFGRKEWTRDGSENVKRERERKEGEYE